MKKKTSSHFRSLVIVLSICLPAINAVFAADARPPARVLVLLDSVEQQNHIFFYNNRPRNIEVGRTFGKPSDGRGPIGMQLTRVTHYNQQFTNAISGFDRSAALASALTQAFAERAPPVEVTVTRDESKYVTGTVSLILTPAASAEHFDFVLALDDEFVGLAANDELDAFNGLLAPAYDVSYRLYDVVSGAVAARGKASATGYLRQPAEQASSDPALFGYLWPYLCTLNSIDIVDQLLRADQLHAMAARVGRGDELPPVAAQLANFERRLTWNLKPAGGWHERNATPYSRVLEPRNEQRMVMRMTFDVEYLIPQLGLGVKTVDEYLPIYDRKRLREAPKAKALESFADIAAPGYRVFRYEGQAGETNLLLMRADDSLMRIVTISIAGEFEREYPMVRAKLEQMIAGSQVSLAAT